MHIKICGLTQADQALASALAGAQAIGLVFYPPSKRCINTVTAQKILQALPPLTQSVALTLDQPLSFCEELARTLPINLWQFHGQESPQELAPFHRPFIKAIRVTVDAQGAPQFFPAPDGYAALPHWRGFMLDAGAGNGVPFDWLALARYLRGIRADHPLRLKPLILAGGLNPDNVGAAIATLGKFIGTVDVSSGVEISPGIKSIDKVQRFIANAGAV